MSILLLFLHKKIEQNGRKTLDFVLYIAYNEVNLI
nr:MAG TPA: hypothetical protein [Caudoviricetes sp.]